MKIPLVAIIGLPNAGKSTLFNKILERKKALTHPEAGTTRDRAYGLTTWNGLSFYLIDTAGLADTANSELEKNIQKQTAIALEEADLILLVADGKTHVSTKDLVVGSRLSKSGKPIVLAINKIDSRSARVDAQAQAYLKLGLGEPFLVSSMSGTGLGDLLDEITKKLKKEFDGVLEEEPDRLKLAFIGKPNVGKSSLINSLLKTDRLLVDSKAGTTRSTVEIPFSTKGGSASGGEYTKFLLLDTAGVKRKWKQDVDVEAAAAMQSLRSIPRVDVALYVVDASAEITFQDQAVASEILDRQKGVVIILSKIDKLNQEEREKLLDTLPNYLPQLWWAPVVFTSSVTGEGLDKMLQLAQEVFLNQKREIDNAELDSFLEKILKKHMPGKMQDQREPKIYNLKQVDVSPPVFKITVNIPAAIAPAWRKFLEKQFRMQFGFEGTPIIFKYLKRI
jgi:GTPase